jgi:hypothetical protein
MQPSGTKVNVYRFQEKFCGLYLMRFFWKIFRMKILLLNVLVLISGFVGFAQQDTALVKRVNEVLKLTQKKDLEKIMDYTYPKLFNIAPREFMIEAMKNVYETDEYLIEVDSVKVLTIFPVFVINDTSYAKVKHTMLMRMKYKEPFDTSDMESKKILVSLMESKYGEGSVRFDVATNSLNIFMKADMVGVKDKISKIWTFANLSTNDPAVLEMLFSKAVRDKLKEYN